MRGLSIIPTSTNEWAVADCYIVCVYEIFDAVGSAMKDNFTAIFHPSSKPKPRVVKGTNKLEAIHFQ